jgi:hypothetical protein
MGTSIFFRYLIQYTVETIRRTRFTLKQIAYRLQAFGVFLKDDLLSSFVKPDTG